MRKKTGDAVVRALGAFSKMKYYSPQADGLMRVANQLVASGRREEEILGCAILLGVGDALRAEQNEQMPRCPFCGRRHKLAIPAKVAKAIVSSLMSKSRQGNFNPRTLTM